MHDLNGGIQLNGLFWTVAPDGSFRFSHDGDEARFRARGVPVVDSFVFGGSNNVPATVDLDVRWEASGPAEGLGKGTAVPPTDPAAFLGHFAPANATGTVAGLELGFGFESSDTASSHSG